MNSRKNIIKSLLLCGLLGHRYDKEWSPADIHGSAIMQCTRCWFAQHHMSARWRWLWRLH